MLVFSFRTKVIVLDKDTFILILISVIESIHINKIQNRNSSSLIQEEVVEAMLLNV